MCAMIFRTTSSGSSVVSNRQRRREPDWAMYVTSKYFSNIYVRSIPNIPCDTPKDVSLDVLSSIDTFFIEDYLDYLQKYEKNGRIYTNGKSALKRKLCALSVLFNYLYKHV